MAETIIKTLRLKVKPNSYDWLNDAAREVNAVCKSCGENKPSVDFPASRQTKSGLHPYCKACKNAAAALYRREHRLKNIDRVLKYYRENKVSIANKRAERYKADPKKELERTKKYFQNNNEKVRERRRKCYAANPGPKNESARKWRRDNIEKIRARNAKWRADKLMATPKWANLSDIQAIYADAHAKGMHVDHVIPLRHKLICGLHVAENLRPLTARENTKKSNIFEPYSISAPFAGTLSSCGGGTRRSVSA